MKNKNALLMVHFGTTHDDTRNLTIDSMNKNFSKKFFDYDFYEAYTSRIILRILKDRGIEKKDPMRVLKELSEQGYKNIIVQSSHIIPGIEYENLLSELDEYREKFDTIKVGKPLIYNVEDCKKIVELLIEKYVPTDKKEALILVCHGSDSPSSAIYPMLEYVFDEYGYENVYVVSTKVYPLMEVLIKKLKKDKIEKVKLAPFMFVAGEHAKKDMAVDYKEELEKNNFQVTDVILRGLGEYQEVQNLFLEHLKQAIKSKAKNIGDFKKKYSEKYLY